MANGELHLYKAIIEKLLEDTAAGSLKVLTGNKSDKDRRIGRHQPTNQEKSRYLGVYCFTSKPLVSGGYAGHVQRTRVRFYCNAKGNDGELTASKIADRLDTLLVPEQDAAESPNRSYLDFSNEDITCKATTRLSRVGARFDDEADLWTLWVDADVIWVNTPCPNEE